MRAHDAVPLSADSSRDEHEVWRSERITSRCHTKVGQFFLSGSSEDFFGKAAAQEWGRSGCVTYAFTRGTAESDQMALVLGLGGLLL
jgi:hypothetical protein